MESRRRPTRQPPSVPQLFQHITGQPTHQAASDPWQAPGLLDNCFRLLRTVERLCGPPLSFLSGYSSRLDLCCCSLGFLALSRYSRPGSVSLSLQSLLSRLSVLKSLLSGFKFLIYSSQLGGGCSNLLPILWLI